MSNNKTKELAFSDPGSLIRILLAIKTNVSWNEVYAQERPVLYALTVKYAPTISASHIALVHTGNGTLVIEEVFVVGYRLGKCYYLNQF